MLVLRSTSRRYACAYGMELLVIKRQPTLLRILRILIPGCHFRREKWLGVLGTNRVEIEEHAHFAPLHYTVHSADPPEIIHIHNFTENVFAGVAKGFVSASFGEQEEEL